VAVTPLAPAWVRISALEWLLAFVVWLFAADTH
jgi:hypothetical protein